MTRYKELKRQAWEYYKIWMREKTISKALNKEVRITRMGWNHLSERNIKDKLNRYNLLKAAKFVIKETKSFTVNTQDKNKFTILENAFVLNRKSVKIKVVLKQDKKGNYSFYSVMKKAQKSRLS